MTIEEIEIIVTAKVEEALKEFMKIVPAIKQSMKQAKEAFSKVDTKTMTNKLHQAVTFMKKKMQDLKKSSENNQIVIKVNNKDAQKQISQVQKQIDSLQEKINARQMKLKVITPRLDEITAKTTKEVTPEGLSSDNPAIQKTINNSLNNNKEYTSLLVQEDKMTQEISIYNKQLSEAKSKMSELGKQTSQTATTQNKLGSFFSAFKQKIEQVKPSISSIANGFKFLPKITQKITNHIKSMGSGLKQGFGHLLKYAGALFSLRGIYSILSNSASSWLSSQNAGAKQLSANIDYMKYSLGSALSPIIEYVINLIYQLMKAIQSVAYALTGVNIFAKASANSYASMAGSAKKAKEETKQLAGVHSEINNIQSNNNSDSGSGGNSPSFDLSGIDNQMSPLTQKLYDFFKPLKESWDKYSPQLIEQVKTTAGQVGGLISSVWGSFKNVITNGTVYTILENILAIIGNIAEAFSKALDYNNNGDAIIQNLANAFNNLLGAINNVIQSEGFQEWLKNCTEKFKQITDKISEIDWQPLVNALTQIGTTVGTIALEILSGLVNIFKWLVENPIVTELLLGIAIAIGVLSTAITVITAVKAAWVTVTGALATVMGILHITMLPMIAIIVAIIAVIALIVVAIMNWDTIMKALTDTWNWICEQAQIIWNAIGETVSQWIENIKKWFSDMIENVKKAWNDFWTGVFDKCNEIINNIKTAISNWINNVKEGISNALYIIQMKWNEIWTNIGNVVRNVWNGIWSCIKGVINSILGGIEGFVNGAIKGINFLLGGISNVANAVGSLIGLNPINLKLSYISLPRLAKGGVLTEATALIAGEYSGAKSNPEIVTPQNIMYDTMRRALSDTNSNENSNENSNRPIYLNVYVGNKKIGEILLEDLRDKKRQTGKDIEALVGG